MSPEFEHWLMSIANNLLLGASIGVLLAVIVGAVILRKIVQSDRKRDEEFRKRNPRLYQ